MTTRSIFKPGAAGFTVAKLCDTSGPCGTVAREEAKKPQGWLLKGTGTNRLGTRKVPTLRGK